MENVSPVPSQDADVLVSDQNNIVAALESMEARGDCSSLVEDRKTLMIALSNLHTHRNALAPVSRLSAELLSEVFLILTAYSCVSANHPGYITPAEARLSIETVCRHWRLVAFGCARLWSNIDFGFDPTSRVRESLERSHGTLLTVQANVSMHESAGENVLLVLPDHLFRTQCLDLGLTGNYYERLRSGLVAPAPKLEVLRLHCSNDTISLASDAFAAHIPCLRQLELVNCSIPKCSVMLRMQLTYLSVSDIPPELAFSVMEWLEVLAALPELQVLTIVSAFASTSQSVEKHLPSIHLPDLIAISLGGHMWNCTELLVQLNFPPTPCIEIDCISFLMEQPMELTCLSILLETIGKLLKALPAGERLRALGVRWLSNTELVLKGSSDAEANLSPDTDSSPEFQLSFVPRSYVFPLLSAVLSAFPTSGISKLDISPPPCECDLPSPAHLLHMDDWPRLFRFFPAVTHLYRIRYDLVLCLLNLIEEDPTIFPALSTLGLVNTSFETPGVFDTLIRMLRSRQRPITKISLTFCTNVAARLSALRKTGVAIEWDGKARFERHSDEETRLRRIRFGYAIWV